MVEIAEKIPGVILPSINVLLCHLDGEVSDRSQGGGDGIVASQDLAIAALGHNTLHLVDEIAETIPSVPTTA